MGVIVEHTIKYVKTYEAVGTLQRHPGWSQTVVVKLCIFLTQRYVVPFDTI